MTAGRLGRLTAACAALVIAGCGDSDSDEVSSALEPTQSTPRQEPAGDASPGSGEDAYCDAILTVVRMPVAEIRADRASYREAVATIVEASPPDHTEAWVALLAFVDDDTSERLNLAADALEGVGSAVVDRCSVNLVLEDWDILRDS